MPQQIVIISFRYYHKQHIKSSFVFLRVSAYLAHNDVLDFFLSKYNEGVNLTNIYGNTPLHLSIEYGKS